MALSRIETILRYIGANVRRLREERGWSQAELGEKAGTNRRTIQQLELADADGNPGLRLLITISGLFRVELTDLFAPATFERRDAGRPPSKK